MSLDGITGGELAAALRPNDKNDLEEKWRAALSQGQPLETEARLLRADGCHRWFSIRAVPLRDHKGEISGWYGANVEIEELKRAQGELLKQTSRLDELFEETPEAVALLTDDDRVVRINK